MVVVAAISALMLLRPSLIKKPMWRATVTPLASIIGSGFLVAGPVLIPIAGNWAWLAMLALCGTGYLFGTAMRHNIAYIEPLASGKLTRAEKAIEHISEFALAFAYFISVTYYLNLFASFALRADDIIDPDISRWLASALILGLGLMGAFRGLRALENLEAISVGIKLALIAGLLAALTMWFIASLDTHSLELTIFTLKPDGQDLGILLGLVILVQGFETSRYLGDAYDGPTRIKTMRLAQLISTGIYLAFILLITPFFVTDMPMVGREPEIITILEPLGTVVAPLVIFAALASQLSAAIADMNGAGGLLSSATSHKMPVRAAYLATAFVALAITWTASIMEIITYASKAFVVYYGLQSALALIFSWRSKQKHRSAKIVLFAIALLIALAVMIFGIPADA